MKKKFYAWLWKKLYIRVLEIETKYSNANKCNKVNDCIKMHNYMSYLKEEIITGEVK